MKNNIKQKVREFLEKHKLLNSNHSLLVAFSGGIDSLCLLDVLYNLSKECYFKLTAAHLNHNWRGDESKREEENAKKYCNSRYIDFYSETLSENLPHTELEARNQRYEFFKRATKKLNSTAILTGHTLTDQAETVLYRIIKGSGTIGLKGIPEVRYQKDSVPIYRPILEITREETVEYCKVNNLSPNIDSSNQNEAFLRNKIRLSLMPELKKYNKDVDEALLRLSKISAESEELIEEYISQIKEKIYTGDELNTIEFLNLSIAAQNRIILDLLHSEDIEYDFEKIKVISDFVHENSGLKSGNTLSIGENSWLFVSSEIIKIIHSIRADVVKSIVTANLNGETCNSDLGKTLVITPWKDDKPDKFPDEFSRTVYVDLSKIKEPVYFRTRKSGDKIQPFGMQQKVRLKKYLINKGIPEFKRDNLPVIATDSEILWVVGVGLSELIRVIDRPTHILTVE
ncbi:MAG: tRNA lysidine(34) synthetase TilS [Candidatus Gastranaerophilales bacterium]|nr:tRNA lysidine(34) synthetase TilS [Candidatus Gastranaerophilales bacterium]